MNRKLAVLSTLLAIVSFVGAPSFAEVHTMVDAQTGAAMTVWPDQPAGSNQVSVFFSALVDNAWTPPEPFSCVGCDGKSVATALLPGGGGVGAAYRTGDSSGAVRMRTLSSPQEGWSSEITVSGASENAWGPSMAADDRFVHVAYEAQDPQGEHTIDEGKFDSGGSVERSVVATTSNPSSAAVQIHTGSGRVPHLWLEWVESATSMGYSEYLGGVWSAPQFERIDSADSAAKARQRIRDRILAQ
jgi:hypothetical protein